MKKLSLAILLFASLFCLNVQVAFSQSSSRFSKKMYIGEKGDTLLYCQLIPDANRMRKYPLVIFLHGAALRGNDNEAQLKWVVQKFATDENMSRFPALVIAPQCPERQTWSNFSRPEMKLQPTPSKPMELLYALIQKLTKTMPVDTNRIYITGFSMGGIGTYDAIERYPGLFAAAIPISGAGDISKAAAIAHIPIWIFLGAEDQVVDPSNSGNMLQALTRAGAHPGFTQYPEVGHYAWFAAFSDPLMLEWLFRQHK